MEVSSWENHQFLWVMDSMAMLNNQRVMMLYDGNGFHDVADVPLCIFLFPMIWQNNTFHPVESYHLPMSWLVLCLLFHTAWLRTRFPPSWMVIFHDIPKQSIGLVLGGIPTPPKNIKVSWDVKHKHNVPNHHAVQYDTLW